MGEGLRWAVVAVFAIAAVVAVMQTAYEWGRGTSSQARTPSSHSEHVHAEATSQMLDLINVERVRAGLDPVLVGNNRAAQIQAEASLSGCFSSHWGSDGLKPYMRYSLAGGYQYNSENASGNSFCISPSDGLFRILSIEEEVNQTMQGFMDSPGHRASILDRWNRRVNIGLAWDEYNFVAVQHFEGDYVEYDKLPVIEDGVLSMEGRVKNGVEVEDDVDLAVGVIYDPPPRTLTVGQLSRTYCYDTGLPVASLRPPLTGDWYYEEDEVTEVYEIEACPNPYDMPAGVVAPRNVEEAKKLFDQAYETSQRLKPLSATIKMITALEWTVGPDEFAVTANLADLLAEHGKGVYTVLVIGAIGGKELVISQYSIFHDIIPPNAYGSNDR